MIITGSFKIQTESAEEKEVFTAFKEFMNSNFQDFEFNVSGKKETLRFEWKKPKIEEQLKSNVIHTEQGNLNEKN